MSSAFNTKLAGYGQWTYRVAWALEIVAAAIGLATGLALGYQAYAHSSQTDLSISGLDLTLASAPFLMVALAELIKIPVATLLFSATWGWKPVLAMGLGLMALITFETVFLGLERAAAQRQFKYEEIESRQGNKARELQQLEQDIKATSEASEVTAVEEELNRTSKLSSADLQRKDEELQRTQLQIDGVRLRNPQYATLDRQIRARNAELNDIVARRDNEVTQQGGAFERQRDSYNDRIREAREVNDMSAVRRFEDERARLRNPVPEILRRFAPEVQRLETELKTFRAQQFAL
jgi:hypothetical protein